MLAVMIFKLPNGFLAVFYALAISRGDPRSTVRNGFAIVLGNLAGLALALAGIVLAQLSGWILESATAAELEARQRRAAALHGAFSGSVTP